MSTLNHFSSHFEKVSGSISFIFIGHIFPDQGGDLQCLIAQAAANRILRAACPRNVRRAAKVNVCNAWMIMESAPRAQFLTSNESPVMSRAGLNFVFRQILHDSLAYIGLPFLETLVANGV
jgi:hypothetical protein